MDRYEFSGEEITLFFYKVATIFTPQLSRSFSLCLYLLLLGLLGGMIVHGPLPQTRKILRLGSFAS